MLGCDAATEFHVATIENPKQDIFYTKEESDCFCRAFCQAIHPFKMTMFQGGDGNGPIVAMYDRPLACHVNSMKCCCYQNIDVFDGNGNIKIGEVKETFYWCIPTFHVFNKDNHTHIIHPPICFGCCVNVCAEGQGCCRVPLYIYDTDGYNGQDNTGKIVRVWGSLGTELIGIHQFEVIYPNGSSAEQKAVLNGAAFLLNELYFKAGAQSN